MEGGHRQKVRNTANQLLSAQSIAHTLTHRSLDHFHPIHKTSQHLDGRVLALAALQQQESEGGKTASREGALSAPEPPFDVFFPGV